ncbi:MAG: ROK family protein [Chloroflexota bacterium]|nr:MAG: ROK family protein [Chloroflexota bacterium]
MKDAFKLVKPKIVPPLDSGFRPAVLANRAYLDEVNSSGDGVPLLIGLERCDGYISHYQTKVFPDDHPRADANLDFIERIIKFLIWQKGGWKIYVGGSRKIGEYISECYSPDGKCKFDYHFMAEDVYEEEFTVVTCNVDEVPSENESGEPLGRHLDGCRIGFDLGASDRKSSAVIDGEAVFSEEIIWNPKVQADPEYHYQEIMKSLQAAAEKMPRLDAIGGSAAGIYIDNQVRIASLFRGIPAERYGEVRRLFLRIRDEMGVPLEIANDGDVTALAGSMSLNDNGVLGIAMGSSEAGGYVNLEGNITGWLNELAFAPIDYNPEAPADEWSGDRGVGSLYFSQQCVFRLAPKVGIEVPEDFSKAEQLQYVQEKLERGHEGAEKIWQTIGCYLGYGIAHYADFYDLRHVLILGRCTSGRGGKFILEGALEVLNAEFTEVAENVNIQLPDEKSRRVGQAIAAASLPLIDKESN